MTTSEIVQIICASIGAISAIVVAAINKATPEDRVAIRKNYKRIIMLLIVFTTMNLLLYTAKHMITPPPEPSATITAPASRSLISQHESITGTSQHVATDHAIWIIIVPQGVGRYYPQDPVAIIEKNGHWIADADIGNAHDQGKVFQIIAVVADQDAFTQYFTTARQNGDWNGLEKLPTGAKQCDSIVVTRQ